MNLTAQQRNILLLILAALILLKAGAAMFWAIGTLNEPPPVEHEHTEPTVE